MILKNIKAGEKGIIDTISLPTALKRRLHMLGLVDGTEIEVMRKKRSGAMVIKVRNIRYAIGDAVAAGIFLKGDNCNGKE